MIPIELQTLPRKGQPARTYCTFSIATDTTVAQFEAIASAKAGEEVRVDRPNVVKGLRKFKLTGRPDQPIREALTLPIGAAEMAPTPTLTHDIGTRYVAELKGYVSLCNADKLSSQDGPSEWVIAGLPDTGGCGEGDEPDGDFVKNAFRHADGTWDRQRLVDALLSAAASAGDVDGVRAALRRGARVDSQPYALTNAGTALHMARTPEVVAVLLEAGANVNARDGLGGIPLTRAIRFGRHASAAALIRAPGAVFEFMRTQDGHHGINAESDTALRYVHFAAHMHHAQQETLTLQMIEHGADVNFRYRGWSPLLEAAICNHVGVARLLLDAGAEVNAVADEGPNDWGRVTALDVCKKSGFGALAELLESRGGKGAGA